MFVLELHHQPSWPVKHEVIFERPLYTYDGVNQLVTMTRGLLDLTTDPDNPAITGTPTLSQTWGLDATGNWSSVTTDGAQQTRTHDAANETTFASGWSGLSYDSAGNTVSLPQPNSPTSGYNCYYDAWNRLVRVSTGSGAGEKNVAEYVYDGLNRRMMKLTYDSNGDLLETRHFYLSSQNQLLEERLGTSTGTDRQYVWGLRYVDDLVLRDRDTNSNGVVDERYYALQDANWNVVAIVSMYDTVGERYTYTAYGTVEYRNPVTFAQIGASTKAWTVLFTGRDLDTETGLYYYRARYYDSELGRFISRDPIGHGDGDCNQYAYGDDRPLSSVDAEGTSFIIPSGVGGAAFQVCYCAYLRHSWNKDNGARAFTAAEKSCVDKAYGYMPFRLKQAVSRCVAFNLSMGNGIESQTICKSGCFMPPYNYGAKTYLAPADVNCKSCRATLNTILTLIHECGHQRMDCPQDPENAKNAIGRFDLVKKSCEQMAKDGVCATKAECEKTIDEIEKNEKKIFKL
jgi:RHS repeat-associated protein